MHIPLLTDLVILLVVSVGVLYVSHHVRLPAIVGFLISMDFRSPAVDSTWST